MGQSTNGVYSNFPIRSSFWKQQQQQQQQHKADLKNWSLPVKT